ncbi:hypothetical protein J6590_070499 [Homalodisca vitripennis]|nr:hypothetical protein J6590_070499 [Homalodisca vitripennis]
MDGNRFRNKIALKFANFGYIVCIEKMMHGGKILLLLMKVGFTVMSLQQNNKYRVGGKRWTDAKQLIKDHIPKKRPDLIGCLKLHYDNAHLYVANTVFQFLAKIGIETVQHPPYSPDLAPNNFSVSSGQKGAQRLVFSNCYCRY